MGNRHRPQAAAADLVVQLRQRGAAEDRRVAVEEEDVVVAVAPVALPLEAWEDHQLALARLGLGEVADGLPAGIDVGLVPPALDAKAAAEHVRVRVVRDRPEVQHPPGVRRGRLQIGRHLRQQVAVGLARGDVRLPRVGAGPEVQVRVTVAPEQPPLAHGRSFHFTGRSAGTIRPNSTSAHQAFVLHVRKANRPPPSGLGSFTS